MTGSPDDWRAHAAELAARLTEQGVITDPAWHRVVAAVPRHVFVPAFHSDDPPAPAITSDDPRWLELVYSDDTLVTQRMEHPDQTGFMWNTSSSTRPSLMLQMLQTLDIREGMTVLEIGTGTGYNTALLSARLGDKRVVSIDIDPTLIDLAESRLGEAGFHPTLAVADGRGGYPEAAPYDRLIATVAFDKIPPNWVQQVKPGGVILADLRPSGATWAGALARLTVADDGTAHGPLLPCTWGFMSARSSRSRPAIPEGVIIDARTVRTRPSEVGGDALRTSGLSLLIWQRLPGISVFPGPGETLVTTPDGAWAKVGTSSEVSYGGSADLWTTVEDAFHYWEEKGCPGVDRFGVTVTPERQTLWLETPDQAISESGY